MTSARLPCLRARSLAVLLSMAPGLTTGCSVPASDRPPLAPPSGVEARAPTSLAGSVDDEVPKGWVGGTRSIVVDAPPQVVAEVLDDPGSYGSILPWVRSARVVGRTPEGGVLIEMVQGPALFRGRYTARVLRERDDRWTVRLDPAYPHDLDDARGFAVVAPAEGGKALFTFHLVADLGGGPIPVLFGGQITKAMLSTPERLRKHVERIVRERRQEARRTPGAAAPP